MIIYAGDIGEIERRIELEPLTSPEEAPLALPEKAPEVEPAQPVKEPVPA